MKLPYYEDVKALRKREGYQLHSAETKFAGYIAEEVAKALQVRYNDKDVIVRLLSTLLEDVLCDKDGLLEQYLHLQLELIAPVLKDYLGVDDPDVGVNHLYSSHAKFADILKAADALKEPVIELDEEIEKPNI